MSPQGKYKYYTTVVSTSFAVIFLLRVAEEGFYHTYRLSFLQRLCPTSHAHSAERSERIVCEDIYSLYQMSASCPSVLHPHAPTAMPGPIQENMTYSMICFQIIHLLPPDNGPQILTEKLYHVQRIVESRPVPGEPLNKPYSDSITQSL